MITTESIMFNELHAVLAPQVEPHMLLCLRAASRRDYGDVSYFYAFRNGRRQWPPDAGINADTPELCVQRNRDTTVTWSPLLYLNSPMPTAPAVLPFVWTCLPMRIEPSRFDPSMGAVDAESERLAFARIAAVTPQPTAVMHEGRRLTAFWKLREPLPAPIAPIPEDRPGAWRGTPESQVQRALWNLALRLNGDRRALDPRRETFSVPNEPMAGVYPTRQVTVTLSSDPDRRFDVSELL